MVAAPQSATAVFQGRSGRIYNIDVYCSDVANAAATFSPSGAAGTSSQQYWTAPEPVVLVDFSIASGMTDTTAGIWTQDFAVRSGSVIRWANQLNTLSFRPRLTTVFPAKAQIGLTQLA